KHHHPSFREIGAVLVDIELSARCGQRLDTAPVARKLVESVASRRVLDTSAKDGTDRVFRRQLDCRDYVVRSRSSERELTRVTADVLGHLYAGTLHSGADAPPE